MAEFTKIMGLREPGFYRPPRTQFVWRILHPQGNSRSDTSKIELLLPYLPNSQVKLSQALLCALLGHVSHIYRIKPAVAAQRVESPALDSYIIRHKWAFSRPLCIEMYSSDWELITESCFQRGILLKIVFAGCRVYSFHCCFVLLDSLCVGWTHLFSLLIN